MRRSIAFLSLFYLGIGVVCADSADTKVKPSSATDKAKVVTPTVQVPTKIVEIKPDDKTVDSASEAKTKAEAKAKAQAKAAAEARAHAARAQAAKTQAAKTQAAKTPVPQQQVKPARVSKKATQSTRQSIEKTGSSAPSLQPKLSSKSKVALETTQVQTKQELERLRQTQEHNSKLGELDQLDPDMGRRAKLPEQKTTDRSEGTALGGRGAIGRGEGIDADKLAREVMGLRGDGFDSVGIGRTDGDGANPARYGSGSAAGEAGAPDDPGHASSGWTSRQFNRSQGSMSFKGVYVDAANRQHHIVSEAVANDIGGHTTTVSIAVVAKDGKEILDTISNETVYDNEGHQVSGSRQRENPGENYEEAADAYTREANRIIRASQSSEQPAPTDNDTGDGDPCNPVSGFGCETRKSDHMEMIAQPVHGDEVNSLTGTGGNPNAGPSSVTNPGSHDGSSGSGGGGGSGGKPGEEATDPEEIIPPVGGAPSR